MHLLKVTSILLVLILGLVSCTTDKEVDKEVDKYTSDQLSHIRYYKDTRTGICFAAYALGAQHGSLTQVECNEKVEGSATEFESIKPNWKQYE